MSSAATAFEKDAEMVDAAMVEISFNVDANSVEAPYVETSVLGEAAWAAAASVEGLSFKADVIERRLMTQNFEPHECIRQVKQLVDTFDHNMSPIEWAASIVVREINMFELAERKRLSLKLLYVDCKTNHQLLIVEQVLQHNG
jgi:hypothetical protein